MLTFLDIEAVQAVEIILYGWQWSLFIIDNTMVADALATHWATMELPLFCHTISVSAPHILCEVYISYFIFIQRYTRLSNFENDQYKKR